MRALESSGADVVVIGTGIGGATFGYALAQAGRSVLFLEQGADLGSIDVLRGAPAEALSEFRSACKDELLTRCGRMTERFVDGATGQSFTPYLGCGTGGSSSLYGMVLERRYPHDFEGWPISYGDLAPWYDQAEGLYEVSGGTDPLRPGSHVPEPPAALSNSNAVVFEDLRKQGLHPYRLHLASRRVEDCQMCQGFLCGKRCKNDARVSCLIPAIQTGNASLQTESRVVGLEHANHRVTAVTLHDGRRLQARLFVLAAGALSTPRLLLASGINHCGLVGKRLMRHAINLFVLSLAPRHAHRNESKELGLNDFYSNSQDWLGTVQSFGVTPPLEYLRNQPGPNLWRALGPAAGPISRLFRNTPIVASILEDKPFAENSVSVDGRIDYRLSATDQQRRTQLKRRVMRAFKRFGPIPVFGTGDRKGLGHVCGTALFGNRSESSVLNPDNRLHTVENLYVVDASFFPTSGGVNPALTIAANALRVADHVHREAL